MWAWMGAMGVSFTPGIVSPSYHVYRVESEKVLNPTFLDFLVRTPAFIAVATSRSKGVWTSRLRLYPEELYNINLAVPPIEEQLEIVERISSQLESIDATVSAAENAIERMKEHRSALISAAVTGKIDVRGLVPEQEAAE